MPTLRLNIEFSKNEGLVMSPSDLHNLYLAGIPLCYPSGARVSMDLLRQKIVASQKMIENFLSIKINKQQIIEEQDFNLQEFKSWGYVKTVFPIVEPLKIEGRINNVTQINYPKSWMCVKDGNDTVHFRNLYLIPNTDSAQSSDTYQVIFSGIAPLVGHWGMNFISNYWRVTYCTGWDADKVPVDIVDAIGKLAAIQVLAVTGDLIYGAGIGNQSISIDGISQTYSTTKGGGKGAFSGRIEQYKNELTTELANLKGEYRGIMFRVV